MANTKELVEVLDLVLDAVAVVVDAEKDGHIGFDDLALLVKLVPDLSPAFSGIGEIPSELSALSADDASAIAAHVIEKLAVSDAHARAVIDAALKAIVAVYSLVKAISAPPAPASGAV